MEVGGKIMITWFINMASPHCFYFLYSYYSKWSRQKKSSLCTLQQDMNDYYTGPPFELITKYAIALNTIFVTLFYCSGMPMMLFCGASSLFLQYWVEKILSNKEKNYRLFSYISISSFKNLLQTTSFRLEN